MDIIEIVLYTLLTVIFIALIVVVGYLFNDYYNYKDDMDDMLSSKFKRNKDKDDLLDKGITDNSAYILNTSNILRNYSNTLTTNTSNLNLNTSNILVNYSNTLNANTSNLNLNTSNILHMYSSNLNLNTSNILTNNITKSNTENIEKYNKLDKNLNDNLNNYFIFGLNTDKNKVTNAWNKGLTESENEKNNKLELIRATSIISGLTIKSENDKNSLNICNAEGGTNCYSLNYDNNILKIKNKANMINSSVEIGSLRVFEDASGVYINNMSTIPKNNSINIGRLKITDQGITWDGKQICDPTSALCSPPTSGQTAQGGQAAQAAQPVQAAQGGQPVQATSL